VSHRVFSAIAEENIVVDMIAQNAGSGGRAAIGFTVLGNELQAALAVLQPLAAELGATLHHEEEVSKVSIVGTGMRTHTGVAQRMFAALAAANINIQMITTGDIKISVLVDKADGPRALKAVHQAFELHKPRPGAGQPIGQATKQQFQRRPAPVIEEPPSASARSQTLAGMEDIVVSDIVLNTTQGRITIAGLADKPGNCSKVFQAVAAGGIVVDMIVQNLPRPGRAELSFSVPSKEVERARQLTEDVVRALDPQAQVAAEPEIARVLVFGVGMRTHTGVARRMFGELAARGINISMINTSEVCVSVVVDRTRGPEALECLRKAFEVG